jgi:RimJ/RimL family protein N-acetyltransferase
VSVSRELLPGLAPYFEMTDRDAAFDPDRLAAASRSLRPHGLRVRSPSPRLVCGDDTLRPRTVPDEFRMVVEPDPPIERVRELGQMHEPGGRAWPNAIDANQMSGSLPTTVVAVAYGEGRVVGLAAATAEAPRLWQVGVGVAAEARGKGLGTVLVAAVARHVLAAGRVPWYAVAPANLRSLRAALAAGFRPAWLEARAVPVESDGPAATAP